MTEPSKTPLPVLSFLNLLGIFGLFFVGAAFQLANPTNADVSWLFVVDEKIMAGARLYQDVIETNPPMSVFLYMPAVLLEHAFGISAEVIQVFVTLGIAAGSLALAASVMVRADRRAEVPAFVFAGALVLAILPLFAFSEREHIAVALILPMLAILVARADGFSPGIVVRSIAGLMCGLTVAIKPQFALVVGLPLIYIIVYRRSVRPVLTLETLFAAVVIVSYAAIVWFFYQVYITNVVPILLETYLAAKMPVLFLLIQRQAALVICGGIATIFVMRGTAFTPRAVVPALAATGFLIAYFQQAKGWPYHLFPALALFIMLFLTQGLPTLTASIGGRERRSPALIAFGLIAVLSLASTVPLLRYSYTASLPLADRIKAMIPHPKVMALSYDLSVGHPLTRMVGGTWVGTFCSFWISYSSELLLQAPDTSPETRARLARWIAFDRDYLAHDLLIGRPDIIIVDHKTFDWEGLMESGSEAVALLANYQRIKQTESVDLLVRRDVAALATLSGDPK